MKRHLSFGAILSSALIAVLLVAGCSRKKDKFTSRFYHQMTSQYNWYFNANELLMQTENQLWATKEDDYLNVMQVFVEPGEEQQKNLFPQLDAIIEKCGTMIDRHSMEISKKEKNKWIDDGYLLIGIANYYKGRYSTAQEMFAYVAKKYKGQSSRYDAGLWLARTYFKEEKYSKANTVLSVMEKDMSSDRPDDFDAKLNTVLADMYMQQEKYAEAIPYLEEATRLTEDRRMKARLTYITAQAHKEEGRSKQAISYFERVVELKPGYEMEFYAKISQALSFDRKLNSGKIKAMLLEMSKEEKYRDYLDQIYFAWAEIELEERNIDEGVRLLKLSVRKSVSNPTQKAKSYLRIADLYFEDREYLKAKMYYDSTSTLIDDQFPGYRDILSKATSLGDLVSNLDIVEENDSLLMVANMDEDERDKFILKMIAELEAEHERKMREEQEALERLQFSGGAGGGEKSYGSGKNWYFYNPSALGSGLQEFRRRWGNRTLEDDWRRSTKASVNRGIDEAEEGDAAMGEELDSGILTLEEYIDLLPMGDSAQAAKHFEIIEALYDIGLLYKERLKDDDMAIESFLRVANQYDTSAVAPSAYYQLYRIYYEKEQSGGFVGTGFMDNSGYWKDILLEDHPETDYAKLILNPDYLADKNENYEAEKILYEETFDKFNQRRYNEVLLTCNNIITTEPDNNFLPKYYLIKALTISSKSDPTSFENVLKDIIAKFPDTEESEKASELLGDLNDAKARNARDELKKSRDSDEPADATDDDVNTSMFKTDDESEHFFALIFPKEDENATEIKELMAQFNSEFYKNANLRVTNSFIDKSHQIVIVRSFKNKETALEYYNTFTKNKGLVKDLVEKNYPTFTITTKNFTVLFRNKNPEVYDVFFRENYL